MVMLRTSVDSGGIKRSLQQLKVAENSCVIQADGRTWLGASLLLVVLQSLSRVRLFATPWTVAYQAPPSMGFSRQEYWSGLPFLLPGDLPDAGIKPTSPTLQANSLPLSPPGNPFFTCNRWTNYAICFFRLCVKFPFPRWWPEYLVVTEKQTTAWMFLSIGWGLAPRDERMVTKGKEGGGIN